MEYGLLSPDALDGADTACPVPVHVQIDRLRAALAEAGMTADLAPAELLDLDEVERGAVIDLVVLDEPSPYVLVDGRVVATGAVSIADVLATVSAQREAARP